MPLDECVIIDADLRPPVSHAGIELMMQHSGNPEVTNRTLRSVEDERSRVIYRGVSCIWECRICQILDVFTVCVDLLFFIPYVQLRPFRILRDCTHVTVDFLDLNIV